MSIVPPATLPREPVYLPFEPGPHRMAMGLVTVGDNAWFELDERYPEEMAERRRLLNEQHDSVFAALPDAALACAETLTTVAENLVSHHPTWFSGDAARLHNRLTDEHWDLAAPDCHPLELAGRLVQEDLCIIQPVESGPLLTAAVLCFPSRWRLADKIGHPLAAVHGPVPLYADRLARPVDRFMQNLKPNHIAARLNWSVLDDPALFQPGGKWRQGLNSAITATNAGSTLFLRVERQTLRRLPLSGAVLFGIRVHVYRLDRVITTPTLAARLGSAVRALPDAMARYKSLPPIRDALLGWLDAQAVLSG